MVLTARLVLASRTEHSSGLNQHAPVQHRTGLGQAGIGTKILPDRPGVQGRVGEEVGATGAR
jgi:hypothetical protein